MDKKDKEELETIINNDIVSELETFAEYIIDVAVCKVL